MTLSHQQMKQTPTLHCNDVTQGEKGRVRARQHTEGMDLRFGQLGASFMQDHKNCPVPPQSMYMHALGWTNSKRSDTTITRRGRSQ